ncbi:glycoside hydrolase family 16 protein [Phaffia rhodozyma]|uniref:Glycoside hydrolase family 16 protein n=1 Tax=Phaffia rhodozyma TaxID=264483 RepID=A0A0F7SP25_PHARH|nr:glycoside hydrolase family 16 protein [Phaffia rhodozyma]
MLFPTTAATLLPLTLLLASTVVEASSHNDRRRISHRRRIPSALEVYNSDAEKINAPTQSVERRKRSSCSVSTDDSSSVYASASASASASAHGSSSSATAASSSASVSAPSSSVVKNSSTAAAASTTSAVAVQAAVQSATATSSSAAASASATSTSSWKLDLEASGSTFLDSWTFWDYTDPTHGTVTYVDQATATSGNLTSVNAAGNVILNVDQTEVVTGGRKSIRLHSTYIFNGGLIIADIAHLPTGCGTWPAFWSNGPNWPAGGEIDIMEGTHSVSYNQVSVHTAPGCTIPADFGATAVLATGDFTSTDCSAANTGNQGCGEVASSSTNSFGSGFNSQGGGVYAMKWDDSGISVHYFARSQVPSDITNGSPEPSAWGTPMANFPSTTCNTSTFFKDHFAIFDTTFCGDWAAGNWATAGTAGGSESCATKTGYSTCADYVLNQGSAFSEAYWEVASIKYYQPA